MGRKHRHSSSSPPSESQHEGTTIIKATFLGKELKPEHKLPKEKIVVKPKPSFLNLLSNVGAKGTVFTSQQILQFLIKYIEGSQLFDPLDPRKVYCEYDELGRVFGVKMFTIKDARKLIFANVDVVPTQTEKNKGDSQPGGSQQQYYYTLQHSHWVTSGNTSVSNAPCSTSISVATDECDTPLKIVQSMPHTSRKRSHSNSTGSRCSKKRSTRSVSASEKDEAEGVIPWYAMKYPFDDQTSMSTDQHSIHDKATAIITNSSDDLWFLEEDQLEFEIESETSSESYRSVTSSSDSDSAITEAIFEVEVRGDESILGDVDSDSDSIDTEISERDKWECNECDTLNPAIHGYCMGCWALRTGWLADEKRMTLKERLMSQRQSLRRSLSAPTDMRQNHDGILNNLLVSPDVCDGFGKGPSSSSEDEKTCVVKKKGTNELMTKSDDEKLKTSFNQEGEDEAGTGARPRSPVSSSDTVIIEEAPSSRFIGQWPTPVSIASSSCLQTNISVTSDEGRIASSSSCPVSTDLTGNKNKGPHTLCMICLSRTKNASIIHGKSAHQVSCYSCAKKLRRHGKPCPVCRRKIQHVVKNYFI
ncbi:E3 ubiquitin-protein ligase Mdm2-like isoform X2 [Antedon mediterranea]